MNFTEFTDSLLTEKGYTRNECLEHCGDRDEHAHLKTPGGDDVILWADGRWSGYDLTQPARLIYPAPKNNGVLAYDLAMSGNWCEECGIPKLNRLLMSRSDCKTCHEAITRHRCTGRPDRLSVAAGESWECPECGSTWTAVDEEMACLECGGPKIGHTWSYAEGDRIAAAPRYEPHVPVPLRRLPPLPRNPFAVRDRREKPSFGTCYRMSNGSMVHVKPGCRCPR